MKSPQPRKLLTAPVCPPRKPSAEFPWTLPTLSGLKGYERLLSLSRDRSNPKWKPLHMSASWNGKNRRIAKQLSKTNWYKGKTLVEPPASNHQAGKENSNERTKTGYNIATNQKEASHDPLLPDQGDSRKMNGNITRTGKGKN